MLNQNVTQIGIVVRDIEKTAEAYAALFEMEVPEITTTEPEETARTRYRNRPTQGRAKLAFFQFKNITLELIEPVGEPSTWKTFLDEKGEGVHHIAFNVAGMDDHIAQLYEKGLPVEQQGQWSNGAGGRYAYIDSTAQLAVILELLESF